VVSDPAAVGVVAVVAVAAAVGAIALADRYQDEAAQLSWEFAALRSAVEAWDSGALAEMSVKRPRHGLRSLSAAAGFGGEGAFAWRALAHLRRTWRPEALTVVTVMAVSTGVGLWAPDIATVPLGMAILVSIGGSGSAGLADEIGRTFFRVAPGRPGRLVLAVELVPFLTTAVTMLAGWLPVAILSAGVGIGGLLTAVALAAVVVASASASAGLTNSVVSRLGLTLAGTAGTVLLAAVVQQDASPGLVFALVALGCATGVQVAAVRLVRRQFGSLAGGRPG
jgi:hypothetical protein